MSSIKPHSKGYRAQVYVKGQRDSGTFRTKREAEAWAFRREEELRKGKAEEVHTLKQALERYAEEVSPNKRGERWEVVRISAFLKEPSMPCSADIRSLTPEDFGVWRDARLKVVQTGTVRREIGLLSAALETARLEWKWIDVNPLRDMRKPKAAAHRDIVITMPQVRRMLRVMSYHSGPCKSATQAVGVAFLLALRTGMRAGEICNLKWGDMRDGFCHLPVTKTVKRDVPLTYQAMRLIRSMAGWDDVFVFGIKAQTLDALFRRYKTRAGMSGFTFHDSRHTAATMLSRRLDVLPLCKMFGWKSTSQALTYFNPSPNSIRQQLERGQSR